MKNLFKTFIMMLAILLPDTATAYDFEVDGFYYNIKNGEASVTRKGAGSASTYTGDLIVPDSVTWEGVTYPITSIGNEAFSGASGMLSLQMGNNIKYIGRDAFLYCTGLKSIVIPDSVTELGPYAFHKCSNLTDVYLGKSVAVINYDCFNQCTSLRGLFLPDSVSFIGDLAFNDCYNLDSLKVSENNPYLDSRDNCNAIIHKKYNMLVVGSTNTVIPNSIGGIGDNAFKGRRYMTSLHIPANIRYIGDYAFDNCHDLKYITVDSNNPIFDSREDCNAVIETATNTLRVGAYNTVIPNTVTAIGDDAFHGRYIYNIVIPNSVTSIGRGAFYGCSGLSTISLPSSVTEIKNSAFSHNYTLSTVEMTNSVTSIGENAFSDCQRLTSINLSESLTTIARSTFSGSYMLKSITLPNSIKSIGDYAFFKCNRLTDFNIPDSLTSIGKDAFYSCYYLKNVTIPSTVTYLGKNAFEDCKAMTEVYSRISDLSQLTMSEGVFYVQQSYTSIYTRRTLYVPRGTAQDYQNDANWSSYFAKIVEYGDIDADGQTNITDVSSLIDMLLAGDTQGAGDVNGDGVVNIADVSALIDVLLAEN